ncbi:hypothetical protein L1049_014052 [Liquidambar formosana]|uniref:Uncharacterized protein n=1 Tax=Liquidambar formosana TaxID=63359 RepID=A0AAP0RMR5_LIQFO
MRLQDKDFHGLNIVVHLVTVYDMGLLCSFRDTFQFHVEESCKWCPDGGLSITSS